MNSSSDDAMICSICFDDCSDSHIACSNGHCVCDTCCEQLVLVAATKLSETNDLENADNFVEVSGRVSCPCAKASAGGCDAGPSAVAYPRPGASRCDAGHATDAFRRQQAALRQALCRWTHAEEQLLMSLLLGAWARSCRIG